MSDNENALQEQIARAEQAEARIRAVQDVLREWEYVTHTKRIAVDIRRALDEVTP